MFADRTCPICTNWSDGDPACPAHDGTYQEGMACPVGGEDHIVIVCQRGAAHICFTSCEED